MRFKGETALVRTSEGPAMVAETRDQMVEGAVVLARRALQRDER